MLLQMQLWAFMFLQESGPQISFDLVKMVEQMTILGKAVVVCLFIMSAWSIGVMIDRAIAFNAARKQSRAFAPAVAGALRVFSFGSSAAAGSLSTCSTRSRRPE